MEAVKLRYPPASCFVSRESFEAVIPSIHSGLGPLSAIYQKQPDLLMLFLESGARNLLLLFFTVTSRFLVASLLGMTGLG